MVFAVQYSSMKEVKLSHVMTVIEDLSYPITREAVEEECADVNLLLADGVIEFADVVAASNEPVFESEDDLISEVMGLLPRYAVGEPYQSEGEG